MQTENTVQQWQKITDTHTYQRFLKECEWRELMPQMYGAYVADKQGVAYSLMLDNWTKEMFILI